MKNFVFANIKKKEYKELAPALLLITPAQKVALLREYFALCIMTYRIRSTAFYNWD